MPQEQDEFGGVSLEETQTGDEFGGLPVDESTPAPVLSPFQRGVQAQLGVADTVNRVLTDPGVAAASEQGQRVVAPPPVNVAQFVAGGGPSAGMALIPPGPVSTRTAGAVAAAGLRTIRDVLSPSTYTTQPKPFIISPEGIRPQTPQEIAEREPIQVGKPIVNFPRTQLQPESSDLARAIEGLSTPENIVQLAAGGGSKVLGATMLASMVPGVFAEVQKVASSRSSMDEKRDTINSLLLPVLLGLRGSKPGAPKGFDFTEEMAVPPPITLTGGEIPGLPKGATPIRPTAGPEVLGPPAPRRARPGVEVPATAPEPMRGVSVIEEIRTKNARTTADIQKLYPQLKREEAADLRRQAWGGSTDTGVIVSPTIPRPSPMPPFTPEPPPAPRVEAPDLNAERVSAEARAEQIRRSGLEQGIITQERELQRAVESGDKRAEADATAKLMDLRRQYEAPPPSAKPAILPKPPVARAPGSAMRPEVPGTPAEPRESVIETIRRSGARTTKQIQALFPKANLKNEQAAALRRQAWGEQPPAATGTVRLYHGEGAPDGGGVDTSFFTADPARAASYGPNVSFVDVPADVAAKAADAAKAKGSGTTGDHVLPDEWVKKSKPLQEPPPAKVFNVEEPPPEEPPAPAAAPPVPVPPKPAPAAPAAAAPPVSPGESVDTFISSVESPETRVTTNDAQAAGLKVKSIADLERLAKIRDNLNSELARIRQAMKDAPTPEAKMALMKQFARLAQTSQLPREAIETATNSGSHVEGEGTIPQALGERPLDWRKNPEVDAWLKKNGFKAEDKPAPEPTPAAAAPEAPAAPEPKFLEKPLSYWEALIENLPKGDARTSLAKSLGVPNQPSKIIAHIKRRIAEIRANPPAPAKPEPILPAPEEPTPAAAAVPPTPPVPPEPAPAPAPVPPVAAAPAPAPPAAPPAPVPVPVPAPVAPPTPPPSALPSTAPGERAMAQQIDRAAENQVFLQKTNRLKELLQRERDLETEQTDIEAKLKALRESKSDDPKDIRAERDLSERLVSLMGEMKPVREEARRLHNETFDFRWEQEKAAMTPGAPPSPPKITTKVLSAQKDDLLGQIEAALQDAPDKQRLDNKVTFEVPGDGTWRIFNNKEALRAFRQTVEKEFPTSVAKGAKGPAKTAKGKTMPKATAPAAEDLPKIAAVHVSEDPSREALQTAYADGTQIVSTDGRELVRIISDQAPGTPAAPVRIDSEGKVDKSVTTHYPNFTQIHPANPDLAIGGFKTDQLWHIGRQAQAFRNSFGDLKTEPATKLFLNPDKSLGGRLEIEGNTFEHNVQPGAYDLGMYNADYLFNMADTARRLGNETADLYVDGESGPIELIGKNHQHLVMPMRLTEGNARPNPAKIPASVSGTKTNVRPGPGLAPLQNPEGFNARDVRTGAGMIRVSYEGGKFKAERFIPKQGQYGADQWIELASFDRGEQTAGELNQALAKATGKEVPKDFSKQVLGAMSELAKERERIIAEGKSRQGAKKVSVGPGAASPAEFEERGPSNAILGLETGNPALNVIKARTRNFLAGVSQIFKRRGNKSDIAQLANAADNIPRMAGQQAGNTLRLRADPAERKAVTFIMQALKMSGDGIAAEDAARLGALEHAGDPIGYLFDKQHDMEAAAQQFKDNGMNLEAAAAIEAARAMQLAQERYNMLLPVARRARGQFNSQYLDEKAHGIDTDYERW